MKQCNKCKQNKSFTEYMKNSRSADGYDYSCYLCVKEYRKKNKERIYAVDAVRRKNDIERIRSRHRYLYSINSAGVIERKKKYYATRKLTLDGKVRDLFYSAEIRAKRKKWDFDLTYEWIRNILEIGRCQRTGIEFKYSNEHATSINPFAPSLDRIDNASGGYTMNNVQIVIDMYNRGKGQTSDELFLEVCRAFIKYQDDLKQR